MNEFWWGQITLPKDNSLQLDIGSLSLAVENKQKEWCIHTQQDSEIDTNNIVKKHTGHFSPCNYQEKLRFVVNDDVNKIEIMPALADRSIVCRPSSAIDIAAGAKAVLYVSTPVWLSINLIGKERFLLKEIPSQRLSDTWFGSSTMVGDLCYATTTSGRMDFEKLPFRIQRITTPLIINNIANKRLVFERVALPVPLLSVFANTMGQLWTQPVTFTREDDDELARLKIGQAPVDTTLITPAREKNSQSELFRAFSAIFN